MAAGVTHGIKGSGHARFPATSASRALRDIIGIDYTAPGATSRENKWDPIDPCQRAAAPCPSPPAAPTATSNSNRRSTASSSAGCHRVALSRYGDLVKMRTLVLIAALAACACGPASQAGGVAEYTYQIVHTYPHDPMAFTQGLLYMDGVLYEGTGLEEQSSIRKVKLETGEVLQKRGIPGQYFGEGIIVWKDRLL